MSKFESMFNRNERDKDKLAVYNYQARILGIFGEEIVHIWTASPYSNYENLGRPTVYIDSSRYTFDFAFQSKQENKVYVAEMKCWIPFENFKHFPLDGDFLQKAREQKSSLGVFLKLAHGDMQCHRVVATGHHLPDLSAQFQRQQQ